MWAGETISSLHTSETTQLPVKQTSWHHSPEAAEWAPRLGLREGLQVVSPHLLHLGLASPCELHMPGHQRGSCTYRGVALGKPDVVWGISSLQIRVVAPCALLMPLSSTRTCAPGPGKLASWTQMLGNLAGGATTHLKQAPCQLLCDQQTTTSSAAAAQVL